MRPGDQFEGLELQESGLRADGERIMSDQTICRRVQQDFAGKVRCIARSYTGSAPLSGVLPASTPGELNPEPATLA